MNFTDWIALGMGATVTRNHDRSRNHCGLPWCYAFRRIVGRAERAECMGRGTRPTSLRFLFSHAASGTRPGNAKVKT